MQSLAQQVARINPALLNGEATVGEMAWAWARNFDLFHQLWRCRFWHVDGALAAWGWLRPPYRIARQDGSIAEDEAAALVWQTHPARADLLNDILIWYDAIAGSVEKRLVVQSADLAAHPIVAAHGYRFDAAEGSDNGSWMQFNIRKLEDIPPAELPAGFRFLTAEDVSMARVTKAHRDAWQNSSATEAVFERLSQTWPYRADLHALIAAQDGTLTASAIIWFDPDTQTAEFEPVGVHQDFRRQGLGVALQQHGMHLAKTAGASRIFVACLGGQAHPAARGLYEKVGFRSITRDLPQIKAATA